MLLKSQSCFGGGVFGGLLFFGFFFPPIDLSILRSGTKNGMSIETANVFIVQWEKKNKLLVTAFHAPVTL